MRRVRDTGSGTVLALAVLMVAWLFAAAALGAGQAAALRHHAGSAADLAALAAASRLLDGAGPACAEAGRVAITYRATLASCVVSASTVDVEVTVRARGRLAFLSALTSRARAGPAGLVPSPPGTTMPGTG